MAEQFNAKPAEIKLLFRGQLDPARWLRPPQASRELLSTNADSIHAIATIASTKLQQSSSGV
ncbi:hypothetical protein [Nostoc sp.]|uniref:hypothetical protein n=1 Tax=Nostoc sp. TaxID=1180 RepID=UPI002FFA73E4